MSSETDAGAFKAVLCDSEGESLVMYEFWRRRLSDGTWTVTITKFHGLAMLVEEIKVVGRGKTAIDAQRDFDSRLLKVFSPTYKGLKIEGCV